MHLKMHPRYQQLVETAKDSHEKNRNPADVSSSDINLSRLYSYGFRLHVIGAFHAARVALEAVPPANALAESYRLRAIDALEDLANQATEPVPRDFCAVISTFYRYHRGVVRVLESLESEKSQNHHEPLLAIAQLFRETIEGITSECGIHLTRDTHAPEQASFVVPGLGIIIVPLVYGDFHSWNLAYLAGEARDVPTHRHYHGVEIHLGYNPTHGMTVLGKHRANVDEGYAMPIPPETDHGWVNTGEDAHHVPFIFGSLMHGGWGVFLDVEAQTTPVEEATTLVDRETTHFGQMVFLEREIEKVAKMTSAWRRVLIPASVTNRQGSGGLELSLTRINPTGFSYQVDDFRIVSIVRGEGTVTIEDVERAVTAHDHFGVPAGMKVTLRQTGEVPMVALDAMIRGVTSGMNH
ncbi:MAG: hypothetical protein MK165_09165 [Pirellulaceae bacterium]|nr:hypothetical protein [Pirellulaceae bacterium]